MCNVVLVQAATAVEKSMRDGRAAARWNEWDAQLVSALNACDGVAKHHDNFPLGESSPCCHRNRSPPYDALLFSERGILWPGALLFLATVCPGICVCSEMPNSTIQKGRALFWALVFFTKLE